jgi:hypothetical protein
MVYHIFIATVTKGNDRTNAKSKKTLIIIIIIIIIIKAFIHLNILVTKHKIFTKIIFEMNGG